MRYMSLQGLFIVVALLQGLLSTAVTRQSMHVHSTKEFALDAVRCHELCCIPCFINRYQVRVSSKNFCLL